MESIKFYKLISPYPEDVTLNCKLTMSDMDSNFLAFKDNDIKTSVYNPETMTIDILRNNGERITIDLSSIADFVDDEIEEALSAYTPGGGSCEIDLHGEYDENGVLTLSWTSGDEIETTQISGFLTIGDIYHNETISGTGEKTNPLRIANLERTGKYKSVLGIVDNLPENDLNVGDRWVTKEKFYSFGRMYSKEGMELVKYALQRESSPWRIPTKEDWIKLFEYAEICESGASEYEDVQEFYEDEEYGEYVGKIAGSVLKTIDFWEGNENFNNFGFGAVPAGYANNMEIADSGTEARFWTDTKTEPNGETYVIYGFSGDHDDVLYENSSNSKWLSIRLVRDISDGFFEPYTNIFGNIYGVVNIDDINQAWTTINLNYNAGDSVCEQYNYDYDNITNDCYVINQWNGYYWEKRELEAGDEISVSENNSVTTYVYVIDENDNGHLVKGETYKLINNRWRMVIDAGTY